MESCDALIAGGGAAGMACALSLARQGRTVILAEREEVLGGVLNQCTHSGFGSVYFGTAMTGVQYAKAFSGPLLALTERDPERLRILTGTSVLRIDRDRTALLSGAGALTRIAFRKLILATGCRERSIHALLTAGSRPAGVMTCGMAQRLLNLRGITPKGPAVILGTGDIGQIVARQLIQSGQEVVCMIEQNETPGGRRQNREQCIDAFHIPVLCRSTVVKICGDRRISAVVIRDLASGREQRIACRLLLTAIGLIPDASLEEDLYDREQEEYDWIVRAGNCCFVHDIVDSVTTQAERLSASLFPASECAASSAGPDPGNA